MCLALISYRRHPHYPLLIATNRDEFYQRPTQPAGFWPENRQILAGRDVSAGGTWMGVTKSGRIALLTNYRDLQRQKEDAPSRGRLVSDFLSSNESARGYMEQVRAEGDRYNGFNLICGQLTEELHYYCNYQQKIITLTRGNHGLSNAFLDTPWPKVIRGKEKLEALNGTQDLKPRQLFELLYDDLKAPVEELPETGIGMEKEHLLSPIFIKSEGYGSRCSTVLMVSHTGEVTYSERTYEPSTFDAITRTFQFTLEKPATETNV